MIGKNLSLQDLLDRSDNTPISRRLVKQDKKEKLMNKGIYCETCHQWMGIKWNYQNGDFGHYTCPSCYNKDKYLQERFRDAKLNE